MYDEKKYHNALERLSHLHQREYVGDMEEDRIEKIKDLEIQIKDYLNRSTNG